jgi:hypothetical protein
MTKLSQFFGASALIGAAALLAPHAAKAVAAALVQVTNTASNPAITQSANSQAAQAVDLLIRALGPDHLTGMDLEQPNGEPAGPYTIPGNQNFVITAVDFTPSYTNPSQCSAGFEVDLYGSFVLRKLWVVSGPTTVHLAYPTGFVLPPGASPEVYNSSSSCTLNVEMHGYNSQN